MLQVILPVPPFSHSPPFYFPCRCHYQRSLNWSLSPAQRGSIRNSSTHKYDYQNEQRHFFFSITQSRTTFFLSFFFLSFFFFFFLSSSLLEEEPEEELESWDVNMIVRSHNHKTDRNQSFENIQRRRRQ